MKPFARRVVAPTLLGIFATTASSATEMERCYFLPFPLWDFWHFCLAFPLLLLLFLTRAKIWVLPPLYREPHSQYPDSSGQVLRYALRGRSPPRFWLGKSCFRYVQGFTCVQLPYPHHTLIHPTNDYDDALTLSLNTFALYKSTTRRFGKYACTPFPIVQFFVHLVCVSPPRFWRGSLPPTNKAYHL